MEVFPGVSMTPQICEGKPCLTGTSVDVATLVGILGTGKSFEETEEIFQISREQIDTALRYASYVTDHLPLRLPKQNDGRGTG